MITRGINIEVVQPCSVKAGVCGTAWLPNRPEGHPDRHWLCAFGPASIWVREDNLRARQADDPETTEN